MIYVLHTQLHTAISGHDSATKAMIDMTCRTLVSDRSFDKDLANGILQMVTLDLRDRQPAAHLVPRMSCINTSCFIFTYHE